MAPNLARTNHEWMDHYYMESDYLAQRGEITNTNRALLYGNFMLGLLVLSICHMLTYFLLFKQIHVNLHSWQNERNEL